jgi:hypothetical protein
VYFRVQVSFDKLDFRNRVQYGSCSHVNDTIHRVSQECLLSTKLWAAERARQITDRVFMFDGCRQLSDDNLPVDHPSMSQDVQGARKLEYTDDFPVLVLKGCI